MWYGVERSARRGAWIAKAVEKNNHKCSRLCNKRGLCASVQVAVLKSGYMNVCVVWLNGQDEEKMRKKEA